MKILIKSMDIANFKGIRALHLDFHPGGNALYGDNATGKSSVYDAFTWLLSGKDSRGNGNFSVKPLGAAAGVTPEVTALLDIDGETVKLRRTLREKWEKPRGSSQARFAGHTTDYFVDDVPRKESEFKRIIAGYIDEKRLQLLTNVYAFARELHWKDRRALLAEICGLPDDAGLLAGAPQFAELAEAVGRRTVDEYKASLTAQRKGLSADLNALPIRIDECERLGSGLADLPFDKARQAAGALEQARARLQAELAKLDGDALTAQAMAARDTLQAGLHKLEAQNQAHRLSQAVPQDDRTPALRQAWDRAKDALAQNIRESDGLRERIGAGENRLDEYRARWRAIDKERFTGGVCPACGQALPADKLAAAEQRFAAGKAGRKQALLEDSKPVKAEMAAWKARLQALQEQRPALEQAEGEARRALDGYTPPAPPVIEDLPDYAAQKDALRRQIQDAEDRIGRLQQDKQAERDRLEGELRDTNAKLQDADATLAKEQQLADARRRVAALRDEQRRAAAEIEELDRRIDLCEAFTRYRVQAVEQQVNSRFRLVRFRLFAEQINGGLADCCEVTVDGVPYADLNHAMQVNAGLDIIGTLAQHYGVWAPLFIDNAESVTKWQETGAQTVRLVVSEGEKELRQA